MEPSILKLIFGVFSTYERNGWIQPSILQFFCDLPFRKDVAYRMIPVHNFVPCASGRNQLCKNSKDCKDVDWIVMIDNDMELRGDFLDTVKDAPADADIVAPSFYMWNQSELNLALCWGLDSAPDGIATFGPGFHELTKCGTGAIFIKPHVFRKLEYPYFRYLHNEDGGQTGTEDIQFCVAARNAGFKIYGNAGIHVGHYKSIEIGRLWDWHNKITEIQMEADRRARAKLLDKQNAEPVDSHSKDSGCSPEQTAPDSVPVGAK